jgi:hypothetical protein
MPDLRTWSSANSSPGDVEAVLLDPREDGIGATMNAGHRVGRVRCTLADKHPRAELFGKVVPATPRREAGYAGVGLGPKAEHMHGDPMLMGAPGSARGDGANARLAHYILAASRSSATSS